ncbi:glycosyltransferase family 4 protein [Thermodesulfobacteriota bacterium]
MNTAIFFPGYNRRAGDLEHAPFSILASIPELGELHHFYRGDLKQDLLRYGVHHHCIGGGRSKFGYIVDYAVKSFQCLRKYHIDLIYCFDQDTAFYITPAARLLRIPIILQVGVDWNAYNKKIKNPLKRAVKDWMKKKALKHVRAVVTLAHHLKTPIEAYGRSPKVLYPFIDTGAYPFQPAKRGSRLQMLFVGRLAPVKGARYLIDCLPLVLKERKDFHLRIVGGTLPGSRSDEAYIRNQLDVHGLQDYVSLEGQVPHSKVVDYLQEADLVVMPSETEGFHYTLLESWACGLPVLATDIPFYREVIDEDTGRICGFSPEAMACGILDFLSMQETHLIRMKHAARNKAERYVADGKARWREFLKSQINGDDSRRDFEITA